MKSFQTPGVVQLKMDLPAAAATPGFKLSAKNMSVLCMNTATAVAIWYFVFLCVVAVAYTHSWAEKLRLLPLFLLALIVPLLGKVMTREKRHSCG